MDPNAASQLFQALCPRCQEVYWHREIYLLEIHEGSQARRVIAKCSMCHHRDEQLRPADAEGKRKIAEIRAARIADTAPQGGILGSEQ